MSDPIPEGFLGNLNGEHKKDLQMMWRHFLRFVHEKESPISDVQATKSQGLVDPDKEEQSANAFKGKAKDDAGKDLQAHERERKELAELLGDHGAEKFHEEFWKMARGEKPDALMLRFLRARKWDVDRAFMMLAAVVKWRIEQGVTEIQEKGEEGLCEEEGFRLQYDKGKSYIHGTDRNDRPITYIHVGKHKPKEQSQRALQRFTIFHMEIVKAMSTPRSRGQGTLVFDMTNFGLRNMDWSCTRFILECLEARYPETLGMCIIHRAPLVFSAIWIILKPLLDPVVRAKVAFTKNEQDLAVYIDPKHFKKAMGGELDWDWHYHGPVPGENEQMKDDEAREEKVKLYREACERFEATTRKWIDGDFLAEKEREKQEDGIMIRFYDMYPYVNGKTVYIRDGTVVGDGRVVWNYSGEKEEFGVSYDEKRKALGIEGECPRYGQGAGTKAGPSDVPKAGPVGGGETTDSLKPANSKEQGSRGKATPEDEIFQPAANEIGVEEVLKDHEGDQVKSKRATVTFVQ